jgi:hypothetical protein
MMTNEDLFSTVCVFVFSTVCVFFIFLKFLDVHFFLICSDLKLSTQSNATLFMIHTRRTHAQGRRRAVLVGALTLLLPVVVLLVSGALAKGRGVFIDLLMHKHM